MPQEARQPRVEEEALTEQTGELDRDIHEGVWSEDLLILHAAVFILIFIFYAWDI